ncbi:MAG TPA: sulfatase-like hydrolase/transferase [Microvirga sp.]|nr:sulfatase-like hydrolase/transferase [Microvirga sp.]
MTVVGRAKVGRTQVRRPNILWYCTDQQRWDTIRALGNPHVRTDCLDALCGSGVAFNRAYCQAPICTPSRSSFLTGRYPMAVQVHRNGAAYFPPNEVLVTKIFADQGYDCGLVGKLHLSSAQFYEKRPDDGFRSFYWSNHPKPDMDKGHDYEQWLRHEKKVDPIELYRSVNGFCRPGVPEDLHQTTWCTERAISFITERRNCPWLFCINPFDPHPAFDPPQAYWDRYDPASMPPPLFKPSDLERQKKFRAIDAQAKEAVDPTQPARPEDPHIGDSLVHSAPSEFNGQQIKAAYYAMIELIDKQLGRIIEVLRATGQLDNTIILFHSDHGEMLGDHGLVLKGCRFFEGLVHVPLIFSWPERFQTGLQSEALVELVDLAPTLLEAAGIDIPARMQGRSLLPILSGSAPLHSHKPHVVSQYWDGLALPDSDHSHASMFFDGRYKSVCYHGHDLGEIFDLVNDPGEFENLWERADLGDFKLALLKRHFDAVVSTSSAGPERISIM